MHATREMNQILAISEFITFNDTRKKQVTCQKSEQHRYLHNMSLLQLLFD